MTECAAAIMTGEKVKQLSQLFDAPQYAQQFIELAKRAGKCRDMRIRAKAVITDNEGRPVLHKKTKAPMIGWTDWNPAIAKAAWSAAYLDRGHGQVTVGPDQRAGNGEPEYESFDPQKRSQKNQAKIGDLLRSEASRG